MTVRQFQLAAATPPKWLRAHQAEARARLDAARSNFVDLPDNDAVALATARLMLRDALAVCAEFGVRA